MRLLAPAVLCCVTTGSKSLNAASICGKDFGRPPESRGRGDEALEHLHPTSKWGEAFWHVWAPGFPGNARWFPGYLLVSWWSPGGRGRVCRRSRGHRVALSMFRDLRCHRGELLSEFVTVKT